MGRLIAGNQALLQSLLLNLLRIDAGSVFRNLYVDLPALMKGTKDQQTLFRLATRDALLGRLDTVIDGVAHQVG